MDNQREAMGIVFILRLEVHYDELFYRKMKLFKAQAL